MFLTERQLRLLFKAVMYEKSGLLKESNNVLKKFNVTVTGSGNHYVVSGMGVNRLIAELIEVGGKSYGQMFESIATEILKAAESKNLGNSIDFFPVTIGASTTKSCIC